MRGRFISLEGGEGAGKSTQLKALADELRRRGLFALGLAGYDGGSMAVDGVVDHCLVVRSDSVHRIQEAQTAVVFDLWERVQLLLREGGPDGR